MLDFKFINCLVSLKANEELELTVKNLRDMEESLKEQMQRIEADAMKKEDSWLKTSIELEHKVSEMASPSGSAHVTDPT